MALPCPPADAGDLFPEDLCVQLASLSAALAPHLGRLDARQLRHVHGDYVAARRRALAAVTLGAAARLLSAGKTPADFLEQVAYNGRRLAKLNVPPQAASRFLREYDAAARQALGKAGDGFRAAREQLRLATLLALERAFYEVREAETQAFYGLFRAEVEARDLDDLLRRSVEILTRTLRARAGRLLLTGGREEPSPAVMRRLGRPRYVEGGSPEEALILDPAMRGGYASYWSVPLRYQGRVGGVAQFGFTEPYRWLPRELALLDAAAERCLAAAERARLVEDLAAREHRVRQLAGHLIRAEEEGRRRLSRELHDEAGQSLLVLCLELEMLERSCPPDAPFRARLGGARELAARSVEEVRRAIAALNPAVLERLGLPAAIRQWAARFGKAHPLGIRLSIPEEMPALSAELEAAVYRLVQECFHNIAKHARATRVNLWLRTADRYLELSVADNGAGFDVEAANRKPDCFGLAGMRERIAMLGGTFEVRTKPGGGTRILARLPTSRPTRSDSHAEDTHIAHG
jgi:signal transduction histidine kinase